MPNKFNPGCPCCGCPQDVGTDHSSAPGLVTSCYKCNSANLAFVVNLAGANFAKLNQMKIIFAGAINCNDNILFTAGAQWTAVKTWVQNGGRLYVAGEYGGSGACLPAANRTNINNFLAFLGSTMTIGSEVCNCNCTKPNGTLWVGQPQAVKILTGANGDPNLPGVFHACTASVSGGTPICLIDQPDVAGGAACDDVSPFPYIAIEKVGQGAVMASGDSNIAAAGCSFDNCALFVRFKNYAQGDLI